MLWRRLVSFSAICLLAGALASGQGMRPDANGVIRISPDDLRWPTSSTMQSIVVAGDPTKPGIYVIRNHFPAGQMSKPHFHDKDRFVTVIKGTWYVSLGPDSDKYEPAKMQAMKAGSFVFHPAFGHHYDMAKDEEAVVRIIGMGPVKSTNLEEPKR